VSDQRDLEASLSEMQRKLRELQRELASLSEPSEQAPEAAAPPPPPPPSPAAEAIDQAATRVAELGRRIDSLVDLRHELDRATRSLQEEYGSATGGEPSR
jgi:multidrug resistance efflux pump